MNRKLIALALLLTPIVGFAQQVSKYDWLTSGEKSGAMTVTHISENHTKTSFKFNDRGRGPDIVDEIWIAADSTIHKQKVTGHAYMGAIINEEFSVKDNVAHWVNSMKDETSQLNHRVFYSSAGGAPYSFELLVKAILATEDQSLALLPSGTATMSKILTTEVTLGKLTKKVSLLAINGFGFTPSYGWFDEDYKLFGFTYGWMGMAPEGWGKSLVKLQKLQDEAEDNYFKLKAKKYGEPLAGITRIKNINVYTATQGELIENTQVFIENGKILAIGNLENELNITKTIDGKGNTLMPGLWDMHTHISLDGGFLNIAAGVTSVRDLANSHKQVMQASDLFDSGEAIGPNIYRAGFIDKKSECSAPTGKLANTLEEALDFVDWYAARGYQQIKIYSSIDPEWVPAIAKRTHHHKMKLSGHIPSFMTTEQAVKDGFDEIQHINMIFLNFLADEKSDTRTPVRFTLVGDEAGDLDLDSKEVNDFIALLKKEDIIVDPTVTIFEGMFLNKAGEIDPSYKAIADHMPANIKRGFLAGDLDINRDNEAKYAKSADALLVMIKKLHDAGIRIVAGTDALQGFTLHRELELYAKAGIPNHEVLKIATVNAARIAGQTQAGTVEVGHEAELILVEGNPLENISNLRKVALVIKGEKLFKPAKLYRSIGIKPFTDFE